MDHADANYVSNWSERSASNASYPLINQKLFESPTYPIGPHTLKVSYTADSTRPRLGFDYLIVTNVTLPPRPSGTPSPAASTSRKPGGAIAGGVIGGVVSLGIAVLVFYFYRRRLNSKRNVEAGPEEPTPFDRRPAHFALSPRTHRVQRKSRLFPIYSHSNADPAILPLSGTSHMHRTGKPSVTNGRGAHHTGHHGLQPQPTPSSAQQDAAIDVEIVQSNPSEQPGSSPWSSGRVVVHQDSGIRYGGAPATPRTNLPPEYTPD
jgi:hypothetical protein